MLKVAIVGAGGNTGINLFKLLQKHPAVEIATITSTSHIGQRIREIHPGIDSDLRFSTIDYPNLNTLDAVFLAVPHGAAGPIAAQLTTRVIDLSADHRLTHPYGLPEIFRDQLQNSRIIANPGCYATAAILAAYPLSLSIRNVIFNCISGYSGAGKKANPDQYRENIIAYKIAQHFHIREIEKVLGRKISFTPHVIQAYRGILCTAHIRLTRKINLAAFKREYRRFYENTFTRIVDIIPQTRAVHNTPYCHIGGFEVDNNGWLVIVSVVDNLMKGAASQAIENMNIMFGMDHGEGLE